MVRICSEHAIGFLKGRFHSLKHLRVHIKDANSHKLATYWIAACVGLHAFAMQCKAEERVEDDDEHQDDPFVAEGLSSSSGSDNDTPPPRNPTQHRLQAGKARREALKQALFRAQERRARWRDERRDDEDSRMSDSEMEG